MKEEYTFELRKNLPDEGLVRLIPLVGDILFKGTNNSYFKLAENE